MFYKVNVKEKQPPGRISLRYGQGQFVKNFKKMRKR